MSDTNVKQYSEAVEEARRVKGFMDGLDWQYHLGVDPKGAIVYPSEDALVDGAKHDLAECGIVEVEIRLIRWVRHQTTGSLDRPVDVSAETPKPSADILPFKSE